MLPSLRTLLCVSITFQLQAALASADKAHALTSITVPKMTSLSALSRDFMEMLH